MKFILIILVAITISATALVGCNKEQARAFYETATREAKILNAKVCAEENAHWREIFITAIRSQVPLYPEGGYCEIREIINELIDATV